MTNPSVRANAAAIFFDVFPLRNPDANVAETDQLMQRQFDMIGVNLYFTPYLRHLIWFLSGFYISHFGIAQEAW